MTEGKPFACGDGYYVLGDDSKDSDDSRFNGPVPTDDVLGRPWLILWPRDRAGRVR
ncbi:MAG: S26 family signal peptidase [Pirellulales bacterium]